MTTFGASGYLNFNLSPSPLSNKFLPGANEPTRPTFLSSRVAAPKVGLLSYDKHWHPIAAMFYLSTALALNIKRRRQLSSWNALLAARRLTEAQSQNQGFSNAVKSKSQQHTKTPRTRTGEALYISSSNS